MIFADAVAAFNADHPILDVFNGHDLKRMGKEWKGPCPLCGGDDRFMVWPHRGRAWCRRCNALGDAVAWAMRLDGSAPSVKGETARFLRERGYLDAHPQRSPSRTNKPARKITQTRANRVINLGALNPEREWWADFLRERRAILAVYNPLWTIRQVNAEARRLLEQIQERERRA